MAKFKATLLGKNLFGKIGGQSVSISRNGSVIKNTSQPNQNVSSSQSLKRYFTAKLTNAWLFIPNFDKMQWYVEGTNYEYINSAGITKTRKGYGLYLFLNQNLNSLGKNIITKCPNFVAVLQPKVQITKTNKTEFIIQGSDLEAKNEYQVFCTFKNSVGWSSVPQRPKQIAILSESEFALGIDLFATITNYFNVQNFGGSVTIQVYAIDKTTGNKNLIPSMASSLFGIDKLNLDIISYYQFQGNANDYFGINNGSVIDSAFSYNGAVSRALDLSASSDSAMFLPNSPSLNFNAPVKSKPFTIMMWVEQKNIGTPVLICKRGDASAYSFGSFQIDMTSGSIKNDVYDNRTNRIQRWTPSVIFQKNVKYHVTMTFDGDHTVFGYINGVKNGVGYTTNNFSSIKTNNFPVTIGKSTRDNHNSLDGYISELTIFAEELDAVVINKIMDTNIDGKTILDIN